MAAALIQAIDGLTVPPEPLQQLTSRRDFPEFYSSSFPIFALGHEASEADVEHAVDTINAQACAELGFDDAELAEMGYAAAVPQDWVQNKRDPVGMVRWYHEEFNKAGGSSTNGPRWYPLGFLAVASSDLVLVFFDARADQPIDAQVVVRAYRLHPAKVGQALSSLRQGDDDYENVKRGSCLPG